MSFDTQNYFKLLLKETRKQICNKIWTQKRKILKWAFSIWEKILSDFLKQVCASRPHIFLSYRATAGERRFSNVATPQTHTSKWL